MGKGKSKGKLAFSIVLGVAGAMLGAGGALGSAFTGVSGALAGMSIGSTLWTITHKPNMDGNSDYSSDDYSRFNTITNDINQYSVIPVIYGTRKFGGLQTWHNPYNGSRKLQKDVVICQSGIDTVYNVCANEELIKDDTNISIYNNQYQDAKVKRVSNTLYLFANNHEQTYTLGDAKNYDAQTSLLTTIIDRIKSDAGDGWKIDGAVDDRTSKGIDAKDMQFNSSTYVSCYVDPLDITRNNAIVLDNRGYSIGSYSFNQNTIPDNYMDVGSYKGCAWIRADLIASSRLSGSNPTVNAYVKGMKVKVYRNNQWYTEYSENPAWIIYDFLINEIYGTGLWIKEEMLDLDSFIEVANYCDETIQYIDFDGTTKSCPRYRLNIVLDSQKPPLEHLSSMLAVFGGFFTIGNQISLKVEKAETPVYSFDDDTIVKDSMSIGQTSYEDTPNRYKIGYFDPNQNWTEVKVIIEDLELQNEQDGQINEKTVSLAGCTSQNQALRIGRLYRDLNKTCALTCSFTVSTHGMMLECGDIVNVTYGGIFTDMPFRITEMEETNGGLYQLTCRQYNASIYNDSLGATIVMPSYTNVKSDLFDDIPIVENLIVDEDTYLTSDGVLNCNIIAQWDDTKYQHFGSYLVSLSTDGSVYKSIANTYDNTIRIPNCLIGKEYWISVQNVSNNGFMSNPAIKQITIVGKDNPPDDITNLNITRYYDAKNMFMATWDANTEIDFNHYEIVFNNKTYITSNNSFSEYAENSGDYSITIYVVDNSGNKSSGYTQTLNFNLNPSNVENVYINQKNTDRTILQIKWDAVDDFDINFYEIRVSSDNVWETATTIAQLKALEYEYQIPSSGYYNIMVKACNNLGFYSIDKAIVGGVLTLEPDPVVNLNAVQDLSDKTKINLSWDATTDGDIKGCNIIVKDIDDNIVSSLFTATNKITWDCLESGYYKIYVSVVTIANYSSKEEVIEALYNIEPNDITNITVTQNESMKSSIRLSWSLPSTLDVIGYEIREGEDYETATILDASCPTLYYDTTITDESEYIWWVSAISKAGIKSQYPKRVSGIFSLLPDTPTNLSLTQDENDSSLFTLTFDGTNDYDLQYYEIRLGSTWIDSELITKTILTSYQFRPTKDSEYINIMVKARNSLGIYSNTASVGTFALLEPPDVQGFYCYQNGEKIEFIWNRIERNDIVGYEIREGNDFDNGQLIDSNIAGISYSTTASFNGTYEYNIKAINKAGKYSVNASSYIINVDNLPDKNIILTIDEIAEQDGTHDKTLFGQSDLNFSTIGGKFDSYPLARFSDVGGNEVLKLQKDPTTGKYYNEGIYTCDTIDLGISLFCKLSVQFGRNTSILSQTSINLEFRTSVDGEVWTQWRAYQSADYTFRYIQFRVILKTENSNKSPEVSKLIVYIDMPDVEKIGTAIITNANNGVDIEFDKPFYIIPIVVATAIGNNARCEVTNITKNGFHIKIINALDDTATVGNVDWRAKGY